MPDQELNETQQAAATIVASGDPFVLLHITESDGKRYATLRVHNLDMLQATTVLRLTSEQLIDKLLRNPDAIWAALHADQDAPATIPAIA